MLVEVCAAGVVVDSAEVSTVVPIFVAVFAVSLGVENTFWPARTFAAISTCRRRLGVREIAVVRIRPGCSVTFVSSLWFVWLNDVCEIDLGPGWWFRRSGSLSNAELEPSTR